MLSTFHCSSEAKMTSLEYLDVCSCIKKYFFGLEYINAQRSPFLLSQRAHSLVGAMDLGKKCYK